MAIRGFITDRDIRLSFTWVTAQYILFEDKKTVIEFEDQDTYAFHDCSAFAKEVHIHSDTKLWASIMEDEKTYPPATDDICDY